MWWERIQCPGVPSSVGRDSKCQKRVKIQFPRNKKHPQKQSSLCHNCRSIAAGYSWMALWYRQVNMGKCHLMLSCIHFWREHILIPRLTPTALYPQTLPDHSMSSQVTAVRIHCDWEEVPDEDRTSPMIENVNKRMDVIICCFLQCLWRSNGMNWKWAWQIMPKEHVPWTEMRKENKIRRCLKRKELSTKHGQQTRRISCA